MGIISTRLFSLCLRTFSVHKVDIILLMISALTPMLLVALRCMILFHLTHRVLAIIGSTRMGCHGIPVPKDPPLGTFHRISFLCRQVTCTSTVLRYRTPVRVGKWLGVQSHSSIARAFSEGGPRGIIHDSGEPGNGSDAQCSNVAKKPFSDRTRGVRRGRGSIRASEKWG